MVHTVHDAVRTRTHIGRALCEIGKNMKEFFPEPVHMKRLMRGIAVLEKCLRE